MLNPNLKLNPKLFDEDVEIKPTRAGYGEGLVALGEQNPNVVALSADVTESTHAHKFAQKFPERFFQCGVAEQNMTAIAAGLGFLAKSHLFLLTLLFLPEKIGKQFELL